MKYVLVMTLSGSCMFGMVILWKRLTKDKYSEQLYYGLLKLAVLFYLVYIQGIRKLIPAEKAP